MTLNRYRIHAVDRFGNAVTWETEAFTAADALVQWDTHRARERYWNGDYIPVCSEAREIEPLPR